MSNLILLQDNGSAPPVGTWPPPARWGHSDVPAFPGDSGLPLPGVWHSAGQSYDNVLPFIRPTERKREFYRGQFSGIWVPDLPLLPGMCGYTIPKFPTPICMALDVFRYYMLSESFNENCQRYFDRYVTFYGYTHWQASLGHMVEQGEKAGWNDSKILRNVVNFLGEIISRYDLWIDAWFIGGTGSWGTKNDDGSYSAGRDQDVTYWRPKFDPWIDELHATSLLSHSCFCWQFEGGNTGTERMIEGRMQSPVQTIIDYFADKMLPHDTYTGLHNLYEAGAWNDPFDRRKWWADQHDKITYWYHQSNHIQPLDLYQARLVDVLNVCADFGNTQIIPYEYGAQGLFDAPAFWQDGQVYYTEQQVETKGYFLCCTEAKQLCRAGYGGGGVLKNGVVF